jgi:hypothetical protein
MPEYVEREFRRYLDGGILGRGFARARCGQRGHDFLIAFSCQGRAVCPSRNTRRACRRYRSASECCRCQNACTTTCTATRL